MKFCHIHNVKAWNIGGGNVESEDEKIQGNIKREAFEYIQAMTSQDDGRLKRSINTAGFLQFLHGPIFGWFPFAEVS